MIDLEIQDSFGEKVMFKTSNNGIEYYSIDRLQDIQNQMLNLLRIVDKICRDNGIEYFLDGGTAIGAYRHSGFVPWDDDLDLSMLKTDYLKLIDILKSMDRSKYFLFDYNLDLQPCAFFGERVPFFSCENDKYGKIYPIKIDFRPLNIIENSERSIKENRVLRELSNYIFMGKINERFRNEALDLFSQRFNNDRKKFISFYNTQYGLYPDIANARLAHPYMEFSSNRTYLYEELFPLKEIEFEGLKSFVPSTDIMLTEVYGDYMQLPNMEGRKPEAARVVDAWNPDPLYKYLIDKRSKNRLQIMFFNIEASLFCKKGSK